MKNDNRYQPNNYRQYYQPARNDTPSRRAEWYRQPPRAPQQSRSKRYQRRGLYFALVAVVVVACTVILHRPRSSAVASSASAKSVTQAPVASKAVNATAMAAQINQVIANNPDVDISVAITDLNDGATYNYGDSAGYLGASTAKVITATLFLHDVQTGQYSLQSTINGHTAQYELTQMIENSDNDAWVAFNDELGHSALEAWAQQMGLTSYDADTNILTTRDMATLLQKLYKHQLLNTSDTTLLLSYMAKASRTDLIDSAVPAGVKFYHKAGWLDDRIHDAAIIDNGTTAYVLVIFTKVDGTYDVPTGQAIFHAITASTVQAIL